MFSQAQVGIGTSNPDEILDIESNDNTRTSIDINNTGIGDPMIRFQLSGTTTFSMGIDNSDADKFKIGTTALDASTRMTITSAGYVGIGDSDPGYQLEVNGDINMSGSEDVYRIGTVHALSIPNTENLYAGEGAGAANDATGTDNTFLGYNAGNANTSADYGVFIGSGAGEANTTGSNNVFIGYQAGYTNTTGASNVFIGYQAGYNETGSNRLYIDNSNTTTPLIFGNFSTDEITINGSLTVNENAASEDFRVESDNETHMLYVDGSEDQVVVGSNTAVTVGGVNAQFQVTGDASNNGFSFVRHSNDATSPKIYLSKSRGTSASPTIVNDGDVVGELSFYAFDGTDYATPGAKIEAKIDGTPGADDLPGSLHFYTTADGSNTLTERMTIKNDGLIGIGNTTPVSTLDINGSFGRTVTNTTSDLTLDETHSIVTANTNTGSITVTLPSVASSDNRTYTIVKTDAANNLTIDGNGAETINGSATQVYTDNYARITVICDGTEWFIIEETATP